MKAPANRAASLVLTLAAAFVGAGALRAAAALGDGSPKQDVSNMDIELLKESLLKLWIIEYTSDQYNQSRIAQKSFEALNPVAPTGDAETDRKNAEAQKKTDKELRHYLFLELDGCIEAVDIADRVLGTKVSLDPADAEKRRFFQQALPEIAWKNILLTDAIRDLARMTGTTIELHPVIPKNVTLEVSLDAPAGFSLLGVLEYLNGIHPIEWKYEGGKLDVFYLGDITTSPHGR